MWILIVILMGPGQHQSGLSAEFRTQEACKTASETIEYSIYTKINKCFYKG